MSKLYNIKDSIKNSNEKITKLMDKIGITDKECNILYGIAKAKSYMRVDERDDYINTIIRTMKDDAMQNVLKTLGKPIDDIKNIESLMIEKFRNETFNKALSVDKYVYVLDPSDDLCEISGFENNWHMTGIKPAWAKQCIFILGSDDYGDYGENEDNIGNLLYLNDNFSMLTTENYFDSDDFEKIKERFPNLIEGLKQCGFKTINECKL